MIYLLQVSDRNAEDWHSEGRCNASIFTAIIKC